MSDQLNNIDATERSRFDALATDWWNPAGQLRTLHNINPLRMEYITRNVSLVGKSVLDIGCGGGLLCEAMAANGADVTGIDISNESIAAARAHCQTGGKYNIHYELVSPEQFAQTNVLHYDVITCMEMLEHVPEPESIIKACATMLKPGGHIFFSTINRTTSAYIMAILGAEYVFKLIPRGTHDYARFIRPSELATWCQTYGLAVQDISGMSYIPFSGKALLKKLPDVNYLVYARSPT